jgi:hypothetical protein
VPFTLVIRYGVITREEAYLKRKFGDGYRRYHAGTAVAVGLVGPRPALALFLEQPRELRLLAGRIWEGNYFHRIG